MSFGAVELISKLCFTLLLGTHFLKNLILTHARDYINYTAVDGTPSHIPAFYLKSWPQFNLDLGPKVTQNVARIPSTLCDLCTSKVLSCCIHRFRRSCIYKKIHYLTFDLALLQKRLPCTLYIMRHIQLQILKLLHLTVKEKMNLQ